MKLYYSRGACSLAVRIALHEMQIPFEAEAVNLKTKQTETGADYYKINPKGVVPVLLLDNNQVLTENSVIQQYLADTKKAENLLPPVGKMERYRVLEWLNFVSTELHKGCSPLFNPAIPETLKDEIFRPALKNKLAVVEKQLANNQYICGDHVTVADFYLFVILNWLHAIKIDITEFPKTAQYFGNLKKLESVKKALQEEGLAS